MLKVCIIGVTGHTGYVLQGLQQWRGAAELAAVAPGSPGERTDGLCHSAEQSGFRPVPYDDYIDMLDRVKPDIAAVACHFGDHAAVAAQALNRGIHVFAEKPLATTLADLELVREAYGQSGASLAGMFGLRYTSWFLTAKQLLQEGAVGDIRLMYGQKSYKLGQRGEWFRDRRLYGGTIPWVGSHAIDWMYWLSGERFHSVFASHSTRANDGHRDLEATALCHFTFSNEVFGSVSIDYLRPRSAASHDDDRIRVVGTRGVLEVRDRRVFVLGDGDAVPRECPQAEGRESFADFLDHVSGRGRCLVSAEDSFAVTEACLKARQSADEGRVVYFS